MGTEVLVSGKVSQRSHFVSHCSLFPEGMGNLQKKIHESQFSKFLINYRSLKIELFYNIITVKGISYFRLS